MTALLLQHLISDPLAYQDAISFSSSAWNLLRLSLLDDRVFRVPTQNPTILKPEQTTAAQISGQSFRTNLRRLLTTELRCIADSFWGSTIKAGHQIRMHPPAPPTAYPPGPGNPAFPLCQDVEGMKSDMSGQMSRYLTLATEAKERVSGEEGAFSTKIPKDYGIEVTPLGTGSAIPSKYRNGMSET